MPKRTQGLFAVVLAVAAVAAPPPVGPSGEPEASNERSRAAWAADVAVTPEERAEVAAEHAADAAAPAGGPSVGAQSAAPSRTPDDHAAADHALSDEVVADDVWQVSEEIDVDGGVLAGLGWDGEAHVEIRRKRDGVWDDWSALERQAAHGEGPDPDSIELRADPDAVRFSAPIPVDGAETLQVRALGDIPPVDVDVIDIDDNGWTPPSLRPGAANAGAAKPSIVSRSGWDPSNQCRPGTPSIASGIRFAVIHYTATSNNYGSRDGWRQVLAVCRYHRVTLGWTDIGYNALVDRYGVIYEGRTGGLHRAVIGAHVAGFNSGSFGVSTVGCFDTNVCGSLQNPTASPSQAMLNSIAKIIAWRFDLDGVDPHGTTREVSGGGGTTKIPKGSAITLSTIVGHTDLAYKSDPGNRVYPYLSNGWFKNEVARLTPPDAPAPPPPAPEVPEIPTDIEVSKAAARPQWIREFPRSTDWRFEIREAGGRLIRSTGGTDDRRAEVTWDLRNDDGAPMPPGEYVATLSGSDSRGAITPSRTEITLTDTVERLGGRDRLETALRISQRTFDGPVDGLVVASHGAFADALAATPLAASLDGPVLLAPREGLTAAVRKEVERLDPRTAYVVGGTSRLASQVEADLRAAGVRTVRRLSGPDRFATSRTVADVVVAREDPSEVVMALGQHPVASRAFPDALSAGAFAGLERLPVVLTASDHLPGATADVLRSVRPWRITVVGGSGAIANRVASAAGSAGGGAIVQRLAGASRYQTSRVVAEELQRRWAWRKIHDRGSPHPTRSDVGVMLANGENWPDALGAGAAAAERWDLFLLTPRAELDVQIDEWFKANSRAVSHAMIAGGRAAVAGSVAGLVRMRVEAQGDHLTAPEVWPAAPN